MYYVTATDNFLSGWGHAEGKINKVVVECETYTEARTVEHNLSMRGEMRYVNIRSSKPYYNKARYLTSYKTKDDAPAWFRKGGN